MKIRPYVDDDADAVTDVFIRAVEAIGAAYYSPEQVRAWRGARRGERFAAVMNDGRTRLVVEGTDGRAAAFIDIEGDGHIDLLYAAPEASGTGAASALCEAAEAHARSRGLTRLYAEASEAAVRFFERRGFTRLHRREFEVAGVPIHNWAVEKSLVD